MYNLNEPFYHFHKFLITPTLRLHNLLTMHVQIKSLILFCMFRMKSDKLILTNEQKKKIKIFPNRIPGDVLCLCVFVMSWVLLFRLEVRVE